ncbi:hypothetical protein HHI36_011768, partial [Cryptolaemus montrouzieri]
MGGETKFDPERAFTCCAGKSFKSYVCVNCLNALHESCRERMKKFEKVKGYKIKCCDEESTQENLLRENDNLKMLIDNEIEED